MADLPTPDQLGAMLEAGEITREEAIEIMSERARREAFSNLYGQGLPDSGGAPVRERRPAGGMGKAAVALIVALAVLLALLIVIVRALLG